MIINPLCTYLKMLFLQSRALRKATSTADNAQSMLQCKISSQNFVGYLPFSRNLVGLSYACGLAGQIKYWLKQILFMKLHNSYL